MGIWAMSHTCRWAYTTLPRSFHVPPRRSMRTIRSIWKNRRPRNALVANTWPDVPIPMTTSDAAIVMTSACSNDRDSDGVSVDSAEWSDGEIVFTLCVNINILCEYTWGLDHTHVRVCVCVWHVTRRLPIIQNGRFRNFKRPMPPW